MGLTNSKHSIQTNYFIAIITTIIIPLLVLPIVGYAYSSDLLKSKLEKVTDQSLETIEININHIIEDVISASNVIALDDRITNELKKPLDDSILRFEQSKRIEDWLHYMEASNLYAYQTKTVLIDLKGNIYYTGEGSQYVYEDIISKDWFLEVKEKKGFFIWEAPSANILEFRGGITLARLIVDDYSKPLGVLIIHLYPEKRLQEVIGHGSEFDGTERYLINKGEEVIVSYQSSAMDQNSRLNLLKSLSKTNQSFSTKVMDDKTEKVFVGMKIINKSGWRLIQITPYKNVMQEVIVYRNLMIWLNIFFIAILLLAIYIVTKQLTSNIRKLRYAVNKVTEGDLNTLSVASGSLEVHQLSESFNYMIQKIQNQVMEIKEVTEKKNQSKLEALQAQINPHFLLNTLNGIKMLCVIEDAPTAEKMLLSLGHLLSNTLGKFNDFITLKEEVECLRSYVRLQKMRYGNTFDVTYNIDAKALQVKVPVLLLQPLVENAIIHAFDEMEEVGRITVDAMIREDYLEIWISDNGKGMAEEQIESVLESSPRRGTYSSMGIKNVKERIELNYEAPCGLGIESHLGQGTKMVLLIKVV